MEQYKPEAAPKAWAGGIPVFCAHDKIVDATALVPNPANPNFHPEEQIQLLGRIIRQAGWRQPITVSTRSGFIVKGHGRLEAALLEGMTEVPVDYQNYSSEAEEYADLVADNRLAELSEINQKKLADIFAEIDTGEIPWELTGYNEEEVGDLITALSEAIHNELNDPDEVPEVAENPAHVVSEPGDIWLMGEHRLICGDSTNPETMEMLMDGAEADLYLTDPPYNVAYEGKTADALTIENDSMDDLSFRAFLIDAFAAADKVMKPGAAFYIWHADTEGYNFRGACRDVDWQVRECLVWVKNTLVLGRQDYHWQHEPCLYGWKEGAAHNWYSDRKQTTVLEFDKPSRNGEHPTMKPVDLFAYQISNSTKSGDIVLDSFGGSGTTMVACETNGRIAYLSELDPRYADVIVKRYIRTTGKDDVRLIRNGREYGREYFEALFEE